MTSKVSGLIGAIVMLFVAFCGGASAQSELQPNPTVEELLRKSPGGEPIVELKGYVGSSTGDTVRLYESLSLTRYYDIPKSAIVSSVREGDPSTGPVKVFVRGPATIVLASKIPAGAAALASARASNLGALARSGGACDDVCRDCALHALDPAPIVPDIYCAACIVCYATH